MMNELRRAATRLNRARMFLVLVTTVLAVGLGVNAAMINVIDTLFFRPPSDVREPQEIFRLVFLKEDPLFGPQSSTRTDYPTLLDLARSGAFASVAGYSFARVSIGQGTDAVEGRAMLVTPSFFHVVESRPYIGTFFGIPPTDTTADDRVVLSFQFWERYFGSDPTVLGRRLDIAGGTYLVSGIASKYFSILQASPVDVWLQIGHSTTDALLFPGWRSNRGSVWLNGVARVPGHTATVTADERATRFLRNQARDLPSATSVSAVASTSLLRGRSAERPRDVNVSLWLTGVSTLVFLISCANGANLIAARSMTRRREYAVENALGATRWRLRRQLLAEVWIIAAIAALLALCIDVALRTAVSGLIYSEVPLVRGFVDGRTVTVVLTSALFAGMLIGVVSLSQLEFETSSGFLTHSIRGFTPRRSRMRATLLAVQACVAVVLVFWAGLFAKSLHRVQSLDLGVDMQQTIQASMQLDVAGYDRKEAEDILALALDRLRVHPGIEAVALAEANPFTSGHAMDVFTADRSSEDLYAGQEVPYRTAVGPGFFRAVGASSFRGRDFTGTDGRGAPLVAVINAPLAKRLWPDSEAIGKCLYVSTEAECVTVIGVLSGVWKHLALQRQKMVVFLPLAQHERVAPGAILIRTRDADHKILADVRSMLQSLAPNLPAVNIARPSEMVAWEFRPWILGARMFLFFGTAAIIIAAFGIYSASMFNVTSRAREIAIHLSLGAQARDVATLVTKEALVSATVGLVAGAALSLYGARWMGDVLFQTSPQDPFILVQTGLILLGSAAAGALLPVVRALRVNPAITLADE